MAPSQLGIERLFIPNGLVLRSRAQQGANVNIWSQNPDSSMLGSKNCLGTFYVSGVSDDSNPSAKETHTAIREYLHKLMLDAANSRAGEELLAKCLETLTLIHNATDVVVEIRKFTDSRYDVERSGDSNAELHLVGTAYNRKQ